MGVVAAAASMCSHSCECLLCFALICCAVLCPTEDIGYFPEALRVSGTAVAAPGHQAMLLRIGGDRVRSSVEGRKAGCHRTAAKHTMSACGWR